MVIDNKLVITLDYSWKCCHFKRNYKNIWLAISHGKA
jgi:hypothetical protein